MKKNALLKDAEVIVKVPVKGTVDQIRGKIVSVDTESITVTEIVDPDKNQEARTVVLPKASIEVLAFVSNPNKPEADIVDGVLVVNGTEIRTGFEPKEVIAVMANRVYVTSAADGTDRVDVYSYNVGKDEFFKVSSTPLALNTDASEGMGTSVLIPYSNTRKETEKVKKEDGTEEIREYEVLESSGYLMISSETSLASVVETNAVNEKIEDVRSAGEKSAIFVTSTTQITGSVDEDYDYEGEEEDDYGSTPEPGRITVLEGEVLIRIYKATGRHLSVIAEKKMPGTFVSALTAGRTSVVKTDKEIAVAVDGRYYTITGKSAISALKGYNYVVKDEVKNGTTKIWFANQNMQVVVYTLAPAEDARGPIETVE